MFPTHRVLIVTICFLIYFTIDAEAGCNGSCDIINGNWIVTEDTHMFNQDLTVHEITVYGGVSFKLENVNANVTGHVILNSDSIWIDSTINHIRTNNETNITVNENLEIVSSNIVINATGNVYSSEHVQGIYVSKTGYLVVKDSDSDSSSIEDASYIGSMNFNSSDSYNTAIEMWAVEGSRGITVKNSVINHMTMYNYGKDLQISNNTFINCLNNRYYGDNLTYENNKHYDTRGWGLDYYGDNGIIQDNLVFNGTQAFYVDGGNDTVFRNNYIENITGFGLAYQFNQNLQIFNNTFVGVATSLQGWGGDNISYYNNDVDGSSSYYAVWVSGNNVTVYENNFTNCASYCILVTSVGLSKQENITIVNNMFTNVTTASVQISTGLVPTSNITVADNEMISGFAGVRTWGWANYDQIPSNVQIKNNSITNVTYGVELKSTGPYGATIKGGENYIVENNQINGVEIGIKLESRLGLYDDILIDSNNIITNSSGIYCQNSRRGEISNNYIDSDAKGITLSGCENYELKFNEMIVEVDGIESYVSEANIENNVITGDCINDQCDKVSFTKVANYGIRIYDESESTLIGNQISNFYYGFRLEDSTVDMFHSNLINFTSNGIYIHNSNINVLINNITYSQTGIDSLDSTVSIENLQIYSFDTGINSVNSTFSIEHLQMSEGQLCLYFVDTSYSIDGFDDIDCSEAYLYEKYFFNVKIQNDEEVVAPQHNFNFKSAVQSTGTNSFTNNNGISDFHLITAKKVDNSGLQINFNPFTISYNHNGITTTFTETITSNRTINAFLDTTAPITKLNSSGNLINEKNIKLNFEKLSDKNDLLNFDLFVLVNDGINFAEWEYVGTYNQSVIVYVGEDNTKYRFKSISRDIFGNVESKGDYDWELAVDLQTPSSFFSGIDARYYFTSNSNVLLNWDSESQDTTKFHVEIFYSNFTTPYLNPESVVWNKIYNNFYYSRDSEMYVMENIGHYSFKVTATDNAGNIETKNEFDFVINFDPESDKLAFGDIPKKWGSENIEIFPSNSATNLDFELFLAMESVDEGNPYFTWYSHPYQEGAGKIKLNGLLDRTKYYLYAKSTDLAGNVEDPLNNQEVFDSNGNYDQRIILTYIPLVRDSYPFEVKIDSDLDGTFETVLKSGVDLDKLKNNEYYLDITNKTLIFGGLANGGFVPPEGESNIYVNYSGVHAIFEVYTGNPEPAQNLEIQPSNISYVTFQYNIPNNADNCKVQRTTNITKGWFNQEIISPCLKGMYEYIHLNPDVDSKYYYRIIIEDEFGHVSTSESRTLDMTDVVKIYSTDASAKSDQNASSVIIITAAIGAIMLSFGGVLLYRSRNIDILDENVSVIESKPVAKYKVEELYLIYKDGRLIRNISAVEIKTDSEIMSGMLTAINDFVQDSFNTEGDLGDIGYGNNKIVLQRGQNSYLAAVIYGEVDNIFKGKMINAVRAIERENPSMASWNGDSESIGRVKINLKPIIDETSNVTREMVDNYFTEKDLAITTDSEKIGDIINLKINISNYSSTVIQNCKIRPEINSSILAIIGIEPDLAYHFSENLFNLGEINSYNEVQLEIKLRAKTSEATAIEIKMSYDMKGKEGDLSSVTQIN